MQRRRKNNIPAIKLASSECTSNPDSITSMIILATYLLSCQKHPARGANKATQLCTICEELKTALSHIGDLRTSGPDGYPAIFCLRCCHLVGAEVTELIQHCFSSGTLPAGINHTNLTLVPKCKSP